MTHTPFKEILNMLSDDIVSRGLFAQCIQEVEEDILSSSEKECELLRDLLVSDTVEIGVPMPLGINYIEFIAWKGTVENRVRRAMDAVANTIGHDKEFAYWLCLRKNVDRYEDEE